MSRFWLHGSGMVSMTALGRSMPLYSKNSRALSSMAESDPEGSTTGRIFSMAWSSGGECMVSSRASIRERLPRIVLISPLWSSRRLGCARSQLGLVLVEKREWTRAMAEAKRSSCRSG